VLGNDPLGGATAGWPGTGIISTTRSRWPGLIRSRQRFIIVRHSASSQSCRTWLRIQTSPLAWIGSKKLPPTNSHRSRTPRPLSRCSASGSTSRTIEQKAVNARISGNDGRQQRSCSRSYIHNGLDSAPIVGRSDRRPLIGADFRQSPIEGLIVFRVVTEVFPYFLPKRVVMCGLSGIQAMPQRHGGLQELLRGREQRVVAEASAISKPKPFSKYLCENGVGIRGPFRRLRLVRGGSASSLRKAARLCWSDPRFRDLGGHFGIPEPCTQIGRHFDDSRVFREIRV